MAKILNSLETLPLIESLTRSRARWRILAFVALAAVFIAMTVRVSSGIAQPNERIARIAIEGTIFTDPNRLNVLKSLEEDDAVKAVIVTINSPGGTTAGGEELYQALRALSAQKPVVAVIKELGASAAYMTAIASDRIFAGRLSLVGSIGVLVQHVNAGNLLDTIGIDFDKVQSGPLKAEPDIDDPMEGAVRESLQAMVDDSYNWFVDVVAERRSLDRALVLEVADGRIVNGRQALQAQLIDQFGGERDAKLWLEEELGLTQDLPVISYYPLPLSDFERFTNLLGDQARSALGLENVNVVPLDGLVSLWHPVY